MELDFTQNPGSDTAIVVAPCHPGEDVATCFSMHQQIAYPPADLKQVGDPIGIFDIPSDVHDLTLLVEQTNPMGPNNMPFCQTIAVRIRHSDEKIGLTSGGSFTLSCPSGSDCDPPKNCQ